MPLTISRYLALIFAIGLGLAEAIINMSQESWQYAPLWIIDYIIVFALLGSFVTTKDERYAPLLMSSWALSVGVMYMAYFISRDLECRALLPINHTILYLIGLALFVSLLGFALSVVAFFQNSKFNNPLQPTTKSAAAER